MQEIKGSEMCDKAKSEALRCFGHRFTGDHKPSWASKPWKDGKPYPLQFKDDQDWLANTLFHVRNDGQGDLHPWLDWAR